jgi:hypothetical protein
LKQSCHDRDGSTLRIYHSQPLQRKSLFVLAVPVVIHELQLSYLAAQIPDIPAPVRLNDTHAVQQCSLLPQIFRFESQSNNTRMPVCVWSQLPEGRRTTCGVFCSDSRVAEERIVSDQHMDGSGRDGAFAGA